MFLLPGLSLLVDGLGLGLDLSPQLGDAGGLPLQAALGLCHFVGREEAGPQVGHQVTGVQGDIDLGTEKEVEPKEDAGQ